MPLAASDCMEGCSKEKLESMASLVARIRDLPPCSITELNAWLKMHDVEMSLVFGGWVSRTGLHSDEREGEIESSACSMSDGWNADDKS